MISNKRIQWQHCELFGLKWRWMSMRGFGSSTRGWEANKCTGKTKLKSFRSIRCDWIQKPFSSNDFMEMVDGNCSNESKTTNAWIFAGVENVIGVQFSNSLCGSVNKFDLLASWDYLLCHKWVDACVRVWMRHFISNGFVMCTRVSITDWHYFHSKVSTQFVTIDHLMWLRIHFRFFIIHPFSAPRSPSLRLKVQIYIDFDVLQHDVVAGISGQSKTNMESKSQFNENFACRNVYMVHVLTYFKNNRELLPWSTPN